MTAEPLPPVIADDPATDAAREYAAGITSPSRVSGESLALAQVLATIGVANQVAALRDAITLLTGEVLGDVLAEAVRLGIDGSDLPAALDLISEAIDAGHDWAPPRWRLLLDRLRYIPERTPTP